jgi:hypothetical protein
VKGGKGESDGGVDGWMGCEPLSDAASETGDDGGDVASEWGI